jgi:hypothetical protein
MRKLGIRSPRNPIINHGINNPYPSNNLRIPSGMSGTRQDSFCKHLVEIARRQGVRAVRFQITRFDLPSARNVSCADDRANVHDGRREPPRAPVECERCHECVGGRVAALPAVADDQAERGEEDEELEIVRGVEQLVEVSASVDLGTERRR